MRCVSRNDLKKVLIKFNDENLFVRLAKKSEINRQRFNRLYFKKPFKSWTNEEKENLLAYMLGFNIIEG